MALAVLRSRGAPPLSRSAGVRSISSDLIHVLSSSLPLLRGSSGADDVRVWAPSRGLVWCAPSQPRAPRPRPPPLDPCATDDASQRRTCLPGRLQTQSAAHSLLTPPPPSPHPIPRNARDVGCELREVLVVFSDENLWGNIQRVKAPWEMEWDFRDPSCWRPFFPADQPPRAVATVQKPPVYQTFEKTFFEDLEQELELTAMSALEVERAKRGKVIRWDKTLSRSLRKLLNGVEAYAASGGHADPNGRGPPPALPELEREHARELAQFTTARGETLSGFPFCVPFTDAAAVAAAVLATGIHKEPGDDRRAAAAAAATRAFAARIRLRTASGCMLARGRKPVVAVGCGCVRLWDCFLQHAQRIVPSEAPQPVAHPSPRPPRNSPHRPAAPSNFLSLSPSSLRSRMKFGVAVHVEPCDVTFVCAVWVYLAVLRE